MWVLVMVPCFSVLSLILCFWHSPSFFCLTDLPQQPGIPACVHPVQNYKVDPIRTIAEGSGFDVLACLLNAYFHGALTVGVDMCRASDHPTLETVIHFPPLFFKGFKGLRLTGSKFAVGQVLKGQLRTRPIQAAYKS